MIPITVVEGDVLDLECDVLLLKYAQHRYGVDLGVSDVLLRHRLCTEADLSPKPGEHTLVSSRGHIGPRWVLTVGTKRLYEFGYEAMRAFAHDALLLPEMCERGFRTLATTIHGAGYGLDAEEALQHIVSGFTSALASGAGSSLQRIVLAERDPRRANLLREALAKLSAPRSDSAIDGARELPAEPSSMMNKTGILSERSGNTPKPHVFVAMPYGFPESEDAYELVIYPVVRDLGYVCEHVGKAAFAGDVLERIRSRIASARFVIADLTHARPNVYLEVGFAWGCGVPVVFVAKEGQELHFDVSTHKCLYYKNHVHLKRQLTDLVAGL